MDLSSYLGSSKSSIEMSNLLQGNDQKMANFNHEINLINSNIQRIKDMIPQLENYMILEISSQNRSKTRDIERIKAEVNDLKNDTKRRLDAISSETDSFGNAKGVRDRITQQSLSTSNFMTVLQTYGKALYTIEKQVKDKMVRQYKSFGYTDDESKLLVTSGKTPEQLRQDLLTKVGNATGQQQQALDQVTSREAQLQSLLIQIREISQLQTDMSIMLQKQQKSLDTIEETIENVHHDVEKGTTDITTAIDHANSARSMQRYVGIALAIIVILVAIYLIINVNNLLPKKNS